jgi:hypothetical protein
MREQKTFITWGKLNHKINEDLNDEFNENYNRVSDLLDEFHKLQDKVSDLEMISRCITPSYGFKSPEVKIWIWLGSPTGSTEQLQFSFKADAQSELQYYTLTSGTKYLLPMQVANHLIEVAQKKGNKFTVKIIGTEFKGETWPRNQ